jgi:hypothetical protein
MVGDQGHTREENNDNHQVWSLTNGIASKGEASDILLLCENGIIARGETTAPLAVSSSKRVEPEETVVFIDRVLLSPVDESGRRWGEPRRGAWEAKRETLKLRLEAPSADAAIDEMIS